MIELNRLPRWVWIVPAALLLIATARLPYGYYMFLRIVVCAFAALIAFSSWRDDKTSRAWAIVFGAVAILFNPLVPIYLSRGDWFYLDIGVAVLIVSHMVIVQFRSAKTTQRGQ